MFTKILQLGYKHGYLDFDNCLTLVSIKRRPCVLSLNHNVVVIFNTQ